MLISIALAVVNLLCFAAMYRLGYCRGRGQSTHKAWMAGWFAHMTSGSSQQESPHP